MHDPRLSKFADVLVNYSVGVRKGHLVRIGGPIPSLPLIVELERAVLRAGAHPLVRLGAEALQDAFLKEASDEQLRFVDPVGMFEVEKIDRYIGLGGDENSRHTTQVDPKRLAAASIARKPFLEKLLGRAAKDELKWCYAQYPTNASAQDAEMSLEEYEEFVFRACKLHADDPASQWRKLSAKQQKLVDFLNGKKEYRVVAANGTDVRMSLAGKTWINCDGQANFPDGEVFTGPEIKSVNGQINFSFPAVHHGREVTDVKLTFRDGKVVKASASKGEDFLISTLDTDAGSRFLGECAIGCNFDIQQYTRNTLFDEKIGGTVHFALGKGYPETGNTNESAVHWDMVVDLRQGGYVEIDGEKVNIDGKFVRDEWPGG
ncbi:MAG TPA: aminopeptidase [Tepidisphaeraceae bacterium]|nr:aminopeptidase [Tepidisphaeraceae bacterium]